MTYVNRESVVGVGVLFIILGTFAMAARIFIRRKTSGLAADDWLALIAWALVMGECSIMIAGAVTHTIGAHSTPGLGREILVYNGWEQILLERFEYPFDIIQILALAALKLSVLLFYRRLFVTRIFKVSSSILIGLVIVWAITFVVSLLAQCGPNIVANFQTLGDLKMKCIDTFAILIALAASDVAVDLVILAIPVPMILSLQLPLKKRIGILIVLMIGMLATACGIARMSLFIEILGPSLFSKPTVGGVSSDDDIGIVSILMFWGMLEMGIAMVAICLPVLYRLLRDWSSCTLLVRLRSWRSQKTAYTSDKDGGPVQGKATYTASCSMGTSDDAGSQKAVVRHGEIWEHTRISQSSEVV